MFQKIKLTLAKHDDSALVIVLERFAIDAFVILAVVKEAMLLFITEPYNALIFQKLNKIFCKQLLTAFKEALLS